VVVNGNNDSFTFSMYSNFNVIFFQCPFQDWKIFRKHLPNCDANACELEDVVWAYARKNMAILNIFIKDPYAKRFMKDIKITKTSYIANSGGILVQLFFKTKLFFYKSALEVF
jgi:hypothetical protein